jgi:hypothetical protein
MNPAIKKVFAANVFNIIGGWESYPPASFPMMWRKLLTVPLKDSSKPIRREAAGGNQKIF